MDVSMPVQTVVWRPGTLEEARSLKREYNEEARFIAGGTLMQMQREQGIPFPPYLISLEKMRELSDIEETVDGAVRIGGLTDLETCRTHPLIKRRCPALQEAIGTIASPAVRNRGTIGGNILYGVGDVIPILLAMNARLSWFCEDGIRSEVLSDYVTDSALPTNGAILTDVTIPSQSEAHCFFRKIGRRETFIASVVTVAMQAMVSEQGFIQSIHLVAGGGVNTPRRLVKCEEWLSGKRLSDVQLTELSVMIKEESALIGDAFASAAYRRTVAAHLLVAELQSLQ